MKIANLLANALECAADRIRTNKCGMTDEEMKTALHKMLYMLDNDKHFNEETARQAIAKMYYYCDETHKTYAPFFSYEELKEQFSSLRHSIPDDYNVWDFSVAANLMYSNHVEILRTWFKRKDILLAKTCELAVSFLLDEDSEHPSDKIWWYINS